jgi:hypothetical protein
MLSGYYIVHMGSPTNQGADIALISTSLPNPGDVILIDVTLAAHNRQHGGPEYSVGAAAILRAREKHDMCKHTLTSVVMQSDLRYLLLVRYIERGASFFVPMLHAKCVIIAKKRLTLNTAPLVPFINGLLPVPPPVRLNLPIVHVRYDALKPPTAHLPPAPHFPLLPPTPSPPPLPPGTPPMSQW